MANIIAYTKAKVDELLALKASTSALSAKADVTALDAKANTSDVNTALSNKADAAALPAKQNKSTLGADVLATTEVKSRVLLTWIASEAVAANEFRLAPDGKIIKRIASGTTRASYDATELALWTVTAS